jgi:Domain of unknown function (DUF222)/HNH endonuclease
MSAVSALRSAAVAVAAVDSTTLPAAALQDAVVELRRLIDGLEGTWLRLVATLDGSGAPQGGTTAWLRSSCRLSPAAARSRVTLARRLTERTTVASELSAGEISVDHARLLTTALDELAAVDAQLAARTEAPMLDAARRLDPARLRRTIAHARYALTPEATVAADESIHHRRRIDVASTFEGTVAVSGVLDAEGGEVLLTALAALSGRWGPDDERSPGQRRADALVELCHRQLGRGELPALGGERPHLTVLVPIHSLPATPARDDVLPVHHRAGNAPAGIATPRPTGGAAGRSGPTIDGARWSDQLFGPETMWGAVLGSDAARRLACDASLTRVVLGPESQPLDVGRRTRLIPPAVRAALVVRDRGCTHPGCDRGPQWTDAHHVLHWADGGSTSLDNLVLLCRQHHRTVHEGHRAMPNAPPRAA